MVQLILTTARLLIKLAIGRNITYIFFFCKIDKTTELIKVKSIFFSRLTSQLRINI
ncbi:MAG: hypothetical protein ACKPA9_03645 [Microcystis sp.]